MRLAFKRPDGGISIINAAPREALAPLIGSRDELGRYQLSEVEYRAHILERNGLTEADVVELAEDWSPPDGDRSYRDAWVMTGKKIAVDMPKAREIHRDRLRDLRAPKLAALDTLYMRADERGSAKDKATIAAQKQALRDVTSDPSIEAAKTVEQLKAAIPAALVDTHG